MKISTSYFESVKVAGDKVTIHKSVLDKALKDFHRNYYDTDEERTAGREDVIDDLLDAIKRASSIDNMVPEIWTQEPRKCFLVGDSYGYYAYLDIETKAVVRVGVEDPHYGGVLLESEYYNKDAKGSMRLLRDKEPSVYQRIVNLKKGISQFICHAWFDSEEQMTRTHYESEWDWKCNQSLCNNYKERGWELRPVLMPKERCRIFELYRYGSIKKRELRVL